MTFSVSFVLFISQKASKAEKPSTLQIIEKHRLMTTCAREKVFFLLISIKFEETNEKILKNVDDRDHLFVYAVPSETGERGSVKVIKLLTIHSIQKIKC